MSNASIKLRNRTLGYKSENTIPFIVPEAAEPQRLQQDEPEKIREQLSGRNGYQYYRFVHYSDLYTHLSRLNYRVIDWLGIFIDILRTVSFPSIGGDLCGLEIYSDSQTKLPRLRLCLLLVLLEFLVILGSLSLALYWTAAKGDIQGAFAMAGYILTAGSMLLGLVKYMHRDCTCFSVPPELDAVLAGVGDTEAVTEEPAGVGNLPPTTIIAYEPAIAAEV